MQDEKYKKSEVEPAFLEDSWSKMSAMLEEEMPQGTVASTASQQNTYKWIALLLLLVFLALGSYFLNQQGQEQIKETAPPEIDTNQIIALSASTSVPQKEVIISKEGLKEATTKKLEVKEQSDQISNAADLRNTNTITAAKITTNNNTSPLEDPSLKLEKATVELSNVLMLPQKVEKNNNTITNLNSFLQVPIADNQSAISDKTLAINAISHPSFLTEGNNENLPETALIIPTHNTKKWTFGLMAGVQQEKINLGFGGFSAALLINRKLANNFTFETGLNFSWTQFNNTQLNNSPTALTAHNNNSQQGIAEYLTSELYNPSDANLPEPVQLGSASWLSLPVLLTYQPRRRLRINMGVEYAQLLQAKERQILGDDISTNKNNITALIAENNISALTGITWFAQKNLALDVRYIYGFTDLSKVNPKFIEQTDTRAALQWSLVYYFNP